MNFSSEYYMDEVIDGFYVPSIVKRGWAAQQEVLQVVTNICKKYNLEFFAEWGTLLGTVRHGGFIPWDDDLDISMKREDYEKFLKIAPGELPEGYIIYNAYTQDDYYDIVCRVINSEDINLNKEFLDAHNGYPFTAGLDIFPLDFTAPTEAKQMKLEEKFRLPLATAFHMRDNIISSEQLEAMLIHVEQVCKTKINRKKSIRKQLFKITEGLFATYNEKQGKDITIMTIWLNDHSFILPKRLYSSHYNMKFGDLEIPVPIGYDYILRKKYGDYMQLVKKGGGHDYPYFERQEKILNDELGIKLLDYKFNLSETLRTDLGIGNRLEIIQQGIMELENIIATDNGNVIADFLENCQQTAIHTGNLIEKLWGATNWKLSKLEEFCEEIFRLYNALFSEEGDYLVTIEKIKQIGIELSKKKVYFIIDKANTWSVYQKLWEQYQMDDKYEVHVLAIPYSFRDTVGNIQERRYELEKLSPKLNAEDYSKVNLQEIHPDIIYINNPYDEYNFATIVPTKYFSRYLKLCTEQLIYIPWFKTDEISLEEERAIKNMKYYCIMPGVVNSDKVVLQSENMKKRYVEKLVEWAGKETKDIWEGKISGDGASNYENIDQKNIDCEELELKWKDIIYDSIGNRKKIIFYRIEADSLLEHGETAIKKYQRVLRIFKERKDKVALIFQQNSANVHILKKLNSEWVDEYISMIDEYKDQKWGIFDDSENADWSRKLVELSDAYYGDSNELVQVFRNNHKPIMIQNIQV